LNTKKFSSVYLLLLVMITGALIIAPAATTMAANEDVSPDYVNGGQIVTMFTFNVENTGSVNQDFQQLDLDFGDSTSAADIDQVKLIGTSDNGEVVSDTVSSLGTKTLTFTEMIGSSTEKEYKVKLVIASSPTGGNKVGVGFRGIVGQTNITTDASTLSTSAPEDATATIDDTAPSFDAAYTGDSSTSNTARDKILLAMTETGSGIDASEVDKSDFDVTFSGTSPSLSEVTVDDSNNIVLKFDGDMDTGATPTVELTGSIKDKAGNEINQLASSSPTAEDKLKPEIVDATMYDDGSNVDTFSHYEVEMSEPVSDSSFSAANWTTAGGVDIVSLDSSIDSADDKKIYLKLGSPQNTGYSEALNLVGSPTLNDLVGNGVDAASGDSFTVDDTLGPKVVSVTYANGGFETEDTLTITFSENIALPGNTTNYGWDYGGTSYSDPNAISVSGDTVTLDIDDQSLTDPTDANEFNVEVTGSVKGEGGNSVDTSNNTASYDVDQFVSDPGIASAETSLDTSNEQKNIVVQFNVALDSGTIDTSDFEVGPEGLKGVSSAVTPNSIDKSSAGADGGEVTLTLSDSMDTADTPNVDVVDTLDDLAGNDLSGTTFASTADGIAPTMDSAITGDSLSGSSTARNMVRVTFSEELDPTTVTSGDFTGIGKTVSSATTSGNEVTLTLDSELATDANPSVSIASGEDVQDSAGNDLDDGDPRTGTPYSADADDGLSPYLMSVSWNDVDGSNTVNVEDKLTLNFSETIKSGTLLGNLVSHTFGTGAEFDTSLPSASPVVTLAATEDISVGDSLAPSTSVLDDTNDNTADNSVSVAVPDVKPVKVQESDKYFDSIQAAINDSDTGAGDTIVVEPGTYDEDVTIDVEGLTLKGPNAGVNGNSNDRNSEAKINGVVTVKETSDVTVNGFTVEAAPDSDQEYPDHGVFMIGEKGSLNGDNIIKNNIIRVDDSNAADNFVTGAYFEGNSDLELTFENNLFEETSGDNGAIDQAIVQSNSPISSLDITGNTISTEGGIELVAENGGLTTEISENEFTSEIGSSYAAVYIKDKDGSSVVDVDILNNNFNSGIGAGIEFAGNLDVSGSDSIEVSRNKFKETSITGVDASSVSGTVDATENYWGDVTGPDSTGSGAGISGDVDYEPWLSAPEGSLLVEGTLSYTPGAAGFHLMSVDAMPDDPTPTTVFGGSGTSLFYWDGEGYEQGDSLGDVEPELGYWFYVMESEVGNGQVSASTGMGVVSDVDTLLEGAGWHMISSPFPVSLGEIKVHWDGNEYDGLKAAPDSVISPEVFAYVDGDDADSKPDHYESVSDSAARLNPMRGYFVNTGEAEVELTLPYGPEEPPSGSAMAMSLDAQGFEPVPEGEETPPAPPAAPQAAEGLEATAAVSAEGVTFEVAGADVDSMSVQVFSANGEEVFSGSAAGNSLSWNADVANGLYIYGASVKVDGQSKPLGIQKLLILQ